MKGICESHKCTKVVYSDASATGYAGYEVNTNNDISHGVWTHEESVKSSTWKELVTVSFLVVLKPCLGKPKS